MYRLVAAKKSSITLQYDTVQICEETCHCGKNNGICNRNSNAKKLQVLPEIRMIEGTVLSVLYGQCSNFSSEAERAGDGNNPVPGKSLACGSALLKLNCAFPLLYQLCTVQSKLRCSNFTQLTKSSRPDHHT